MFEILKTREPIRFMIQAKPACAVSLVLIILCFVTLFTKGLNWGLDFTGGTVLEVEFAQSVELDEVLCESEEGGIGERD